MSTALEMIQRRAKQLQKVHPRMKWTDLTSKASKQLRSEGKFGKGEKKKTKKHSPAKKIVSHSHAEHGMSVSQLKSAIHKKLREQKDRKIISLHYATTKRDKKSIRSDIRKINKEMNNLK